MKRLQLTLLFIVLLLVQGVSQIVLLGDNAPYANRNDGNFNKVWAYWRAHKQSPDWTTTVVEGKGIMGMSNGSLYSMCDVGRAESVVLNNNPAYQIPQAGDVLKWSFGSDLEYISNGTLTLSLVFGEQERVLAERVQLTGSDKTIEHFKGTYTLTTQDAQAGWPRVRVTFYSERDIKVYLHYVNVSVVVPNWGGALLNTTPVMNGVQLTWKGKDDQYTIHRSHNEREGYKKIGETEGSAFVDTSLVNGLAYKYVVVREKYSSNVVAFSKTDNVPPAAPTQLKVDVYDTEIKLSWQKSKDADTESYSVYRADADGRSTIEIAHHITKNHFVDFTPTKEAVNTYYVCARDYSGNKSTPSEQITAKVKAVKGTSFSDLIQPMPIHSTLRSDVWGVEGVLPRDPNNGIESPDWSYWGGRPVADQDGKYHLLVTRWPANATKGHWEWPHSTVAHAVAVKPTGPYVVKEDIAYDFHDGLGHNPDIILLNDGTYLLYSLIDWEATIFSSETMNGPWKRLGVMKVDWQASGENEKLAYRYARNLSGVQLDDGRFLFVSKGGEMILSKTDDPLGPYTVETEAIQGNNIIPEKYRNSNYEDPVLWRDEVQFHLMINAFWDYRCIYLRSPDGIHWKFNLGTAYTPGSTSYIDGTRTNWYKLERPHVLTDKYGRATHLSLAVIDVPKADDLARDEHSSKNVIMPLVVSKRLKMLNKKLVTAATKRIRVLLLSEQGFNPHTDIDLETLRYGASEEVDFGKGCRLTRTRKKGKDLLLEFNGAGNGITEANFVGKLLGKTKKGALLVGYSKLKKE